MGGRAGCTGGPCGRADGAMLERLLNPTLKLEVSAPLDGPTLGWMCPPCLKAVRAEGHTSSCVPWPGCVPFHKPHSCTLGAHIAPPQPERV